MNNVETTGRKSSLTLRSDEAQDRQKFFLTTQLQIQTKSSVTAGGMQQSPKTYQYSLEHHTSST